MKDYYKILGLKKDASEEEIRNQWAHLVKKYHPDQLKGEGGEDRRLKEINEAYQVLKHSSTRTKYDLKMIYDQRKRRLNGARTSIIISGLIGFILIGASYFSGDKPSLPDQSSIPTKLAATVQNPFDIGTIPPFFKDSPDRTSQKKSETPNPKFPTTEEAVVERVDLEESLTLPTTSNKNLPLEIRKSVDKVSFKRDESKVSSPESNLNPISTITIQPLQSIERPASEQKDSTVFQIIQPSLQSISDKGDKRIESREIEVQIAQVASPSLLTTEEEVRRFFLRYAEQYRQKNLDGFLSLFSQKAIQNQRDGMERLREVYGNFFNLSKEIRYRIEEMKIEIYQNAVEVKARYEIVQVTKRDKERSWGGDIRWVLIKEGGELKILSLDYQHHKSS